MMVTQVDAAAEIARLDALSTRVQTPCGPDAKMVWRRWGSGPHLVLIHGGAGSWMHWIRNVEALSATRTVWAPDIPGFGDSDLPREGLDADTLYPCVLSGLREVIGDEPFDLAGFSFGGLVAALIASERPANLRRLVLVSIASMGLLSENPVLRPMRGVTDPSERRDILRFNLNALMLYSADAVDDLAMAVQAASAPRDRVKNRKIVLTDILLRLCHEWRCPVFAIWGRQDLLYRNQIDRLMSVSATLGLTDRVVVEGAGHWLQYEKAEEFNALLTDFLDRPITAESGGRHVN
jgi:2-hydroxy-6-oxonona-2,4-dienedioate hydrolase